MSMLLRGTGALRAACVAVAFFATGLLSAADRAPAARLVPGGASVFLQITDVPKTGADWKKSALGRLWDSSELAEFRKEIETKWEEALSDSADSKFPVKELLSLPQGEIALAVLQEDGGPIGGVLLLEYGDKQAALDKALDALDKALEEEEAIKSTDTVGGTEITVFSFKDGNDDEVPYKLAYCTKDGCVLFGTSTSILEGVLGRWDGKDSDCLAEDEIYSYIQAKSRLESSTASSMSYFISPIDLVRGVLASNEQLALQGVIFNTYLQSLGLGQLKGIGGSAEIAQGDYDSWGRTVIYADQPAKGIMKVFQFPAKKISVPNWVGEEVSQFSTFHWDSAGAWSGITAVGDAIMGRPGNFAATIDKVSKQPPNVHIKKDVIDQLSGDVTIISNGVELSDSGTPQEKQVIMLELKDESKIKELVDRLTALAPQIEKREFEGTPIYDVPGNGQIAPSLAVANGQFLFSTNSPAIESVLRSKTADKPLSDSVDFKALTKGVPDDVSFFTFSRLDKTLEVFYESARKGDFDAVAEGKIDFKTLPEFETIRKYFRPQFSYAIPDENGAVIDSYTLPLK